jgi:hypothetical protein
MVNALPSFKDHPIIINGFTNLIIEIFGENVGSHARSLAPCIMAPLCRLGEPIFPLRPPVPADVQA